MLCTTKCFYNSEYNLYGFRKTGNLVFDMIISRRMIPNICLNFNIKNTFWIILDKIDIHIHKMTYNDTKNMEKIIQSIASSFSFCIILDRGIQS